MNVVCLLLINRNVRSLKNILLVFSTVAWLGMSMHCRLEAVPGFEFLACVTESDCHNNEQSAGGQSPDTGRDGCCFVEKTDYKINQTRLTLLAPELILLSSMLVTDSADSLPAEVSPGFLTTAPPELPASWQFLSRTALPVRAPSLVS